MRNGKDSDIQNLEITKKNSINKISSKNNR